MMFQLPKTVAANIAHFTGRTWLLPTLLEWFEQPDARIFILTGEPGTGKSTIAAWLAGAGPLPSGADAKSQLEQIRAWVKAAHFCIAPSGSAAPKAFAQSMAEQLTRNVRGFGDVLAATLADLVRISARQDVGQVAAGGSVTGIYIERFDLGVLGDELSFDRTLREPLKKLYDDGYDEPMILYDEPMILLVDALDEAATYTGAIDVVRLLAKLSDLPEQVRILATTRPDPRVLKYYRDVKPFDLLEDAPTGMGDVRLYAYERLAALDDEQRIGLADRISQAAEGNFLYAHLVLSDLLPRLPGIPDLAAIPLPKGLGGWYHDFLNRELGADEDRWYERFKPLLGLIAVAQGDGLSRTQIERITGQDAERTLRICKQYLDDGLPEGPFRPFHRSFADFLLEDEENIDYHVDAATVHRWIAGHYWDTYDGRWREYDDYGLRYIATHLAQATQGSSQPQRHEQTERLVGLALNPDFQQAHQERLGDLAALQRDLEQGLASAAADNHPQALPLVVETALAFVAFRREQLRPEQLFDLARAGDVETAERRLALFSTELEWHQAVSLTIAWLASQRSLDAARKLRDRIAGDLPTSGPLPLLLERVNATLEGTPLPALDLPPAPPSEVVGEIVAQMGGLKVKEGLLLEYGIDPFLQPTQMIADPLATLGDAAPVYVAERDGPLLVAYAADDPDEGNRYLKQYLALHAANSYVHYRNRSLWVLLHAVLRHPDQNWVQKTLLALAETALTGSRLEFHEGLPLTILALQTLTGKPGVDQTLENRRRQIQAAAAELTEKQWERERGDSWGSHKRRLTTLAEASALLLHNQAEASSLLDQALNLPYGFAGFQSPACLTLAEAIRVCRPGDGGAINRAMHAAEAAAHNIQDATFCARTTARFNAMSLRWWGWPPDGFDVVAAAKHLCQEPYAPEFAALHLVGEQYQYRLLGPGKMPLPEWVGQANTLEVLAQVYQRPLAEFQQLNREQGRATDELLPPATAVNVPDPEFAPLLAARFAAEALVDASLPANRRVELTQSLVPIAAANPTALDTVLSRLLLAACPTDPTVLDALLEIAEGSLGEEWSGGWE